MNLKNRVVQLGLLPGGELGLVYEDGQPIPPADVAAHHRRPTVGADYRVDG